MDVKFLRFLELSSEFCKEPEGYITLNNTDFLTGFSITYTGNCNGITDAPSKLEQFKSQKQA